MLLMSLLVQHLFVYHVCHSICLSLLCFIFGPTFSLSLPHRVLFPRVMLHHLILPSSRHEWGGRVLPRIVRLVAIFTIDGWPHPPSGVQPHPPSGGWIGPIHHVHWVVDIPIHWVVDGLAHPSSDRRPHPPSCGRPRTPIGRRGPIHRVVDGLAPSTAVHWQNPEGDQIVISIIPLIQFWWARFTIFCLVPQSYHICLIWIFPFDDIFAYLNDLYSHSCCLVWISAFVCCLWYCNKIQLWSRSNVPLHNTYGHAAFSL
jgi:hypothetical protein